MVIYDKICINDDHNKLKWQYIYSNAGAGDLSLAQIFKPITNYFPDRSFHGRDIGGRGYGARRGGGGWALYQSHVSLNAV